MATNGEIPIPDGVELVDAEEQNPAKVKLESLFHGATAEGVNEKEVRAVYQPGDLLVIFKDGENGFDQKDETRLAQILNEVGNLVA